MSNADHIKMLLTLFGAQVPTLLVCFAAVLVILGRWKEASKGSMWALLGFGLAMALCIIVPVAQFGLQEWVTQNGGTMSERASAFAGLGFFWSVLRAVTYALLLVAVFAGRATPSSASAAI